jgi:transcriptional regulator CBF1
MPPDTPSKRKRGAADHGMARPSPASRAAAAASAAAAAAVAAQESVDSFDEAQINQLIAHNKGHHHPAAVQQNGAGPSTAASAEAAAVAAASATAQAALTHYQVPASFEGSSAQHHDPGDPDGFGMTHDAYALNQLKEAAQMADADGNKPVVGSDEWHRVRRNNHKEGSSSIAVSSMANVKQWSAAVARPSMRASPRSPRLSPAARRTRAPSSIAQCNSSSS